MTSGGRAYSTNQKGSLTSEKVNCHEVGHVPLVRSGAQRRAAEAAVSPILLPPSESRAYRTPTLMLSLRGLCENLIPCG